jgi:Zinc finger, C3HC4 type (RING finger)
LFSHSFIFVTMQYRYHYHPQRHSNQSFLLHLKHSPVHFPHAITAPNMLLMTPDNNALVIEAPIRVNDTMSEAIKKAKLAVIIALGLTNDLISNIDIFDNVAHDYDIQLFGNVENKPGISDSTDDNNNISITEYYRQRNIELSEVGFYFRYMTSYQRHARMEAINQYYLEQNNINNIINNNINHHILHHHHPQQHQQQQHQQQQHQQQQQSYENNSTETPTNMETSILRHSSTTPTLCIICLENDRRVVLMPCRHLSMCVHCAESVTSTCPVCRCDIEGQLTVFV